MILIVCLPSFLNEISGNFLFGSRPSLSVQPQIPEGVLSPRQSCIIMALSEPSSQKSFSPTVASLNWIKKKLLSLGFRTGFLPHP